MAAPAPIDWVTVENGLIAWFNTATDMVTVWANQDAPRPPYPYAHLNVIDVSRVGGPDELVFTTNLGNPAGQEIEVDTGGQRTMVVSCMIHAREGDFQNPLLHPRNLMTRARASLGMLSFLETLRAAGIFYSTEGPVLDVSVPISDTMINRAQMDVTFLLSANVQELTGFVDNILLSGAFGNADPALDFTDLPIP